ncbi:MAG: DUF3369 domain-containing protein [Clostridia bacterium]|nr:DUF3369 domain-containing protein [Clostridia bacterium]
MLDSSNELVFADDTFIFADEDSYSEKENGKWKLLIVDDEHEVHNVTKMVLNKLEFEGRKLEFLSAFSGAEARTLMRKHPDIAIILLDVVMEEDDVGLKTVKYIREELGNKLVRIILRTGQPGQAPEEKVVLDYDINDYKEKTELTSQKLYTTILSSLRAYRDLNIIDTSRKGLRGIVDSFSAMFFEQPLKDFAGKVLAQLASIIELNSFECINSSSFAAVKKNNEFFILSATGIYQKDEGRKIQEAVPGDILSFLYSAYAKKHIVYHDKYLAIYLKGMTGSESLLFFEGCSFLDDMTMDLIEVFCSNVSAVSEAIISSNKYEAERQQRQLSEKLRELNMDLTSTLNVDEIMSKLLESISQVIKFDRGLAVLAEESGYKLVTVKENGRFSIVNHSLKPFELKILAGMEERKLYSIPDINNKPEGTNMSFQSYLVVPIVYQDDLFGAILMESFKSDAFTSKDEDVAFTFAGQAGLAIENASLFCEIINRNADIRNLLDNAGQGFLTFGESLSIDGEYSAECVNIFGKEIKGEKFAELIYSDKEQQKYLEIMIRKVLSINSGDIRDIYLPLLPNEIRVNERYIDVKYKILEGNAENFRTFMVILTDVSERKFLENKIEKERNLLKMVVKAVTDYEDMTKCVRDYEEFCMYGMGEIILGKGTAESTIFEVIRKVHTFKGSFSQLDMINIVSKLHEFETLLSEWKKCEDAVIIENLRSKIDSDEMLSWIKSDLDVLRDILGEDYLNHQKVIFVDQAKLLEIEKKVESILPAAGRELLLKDLKHLRFRPFKELLKQYPGYVGKIALHLDKQLNPLVIKGGDFPVNMEKYESFTRSLVHVFRNAVVHGIESADIRASKGKSESANITCSVNLIDNCIAITITDDGCGIDTEKIRIAAVEQGVLDEHAACALSEEKALNLVFEEYFTTRTEADHYSGRGVGLAAVMSEVNSISGTIEVESSKGSGTCFRFLLPYRE